MTIAAMRNLVVLSSLCIVGASVLFFSISPVFLPLDFPQAWEVAKPIFPVFLGMLGAAVQFVGSNGPRSRRKAPQLLGALIFGPMIIYVIGFIALVSVFGFSNRLEAPIPNRGMGREDLSTGLALLLAVIAASTSAGIAILFKAENRNAD